MIVHRRAGRVFLLDDQGRVLLLRGSDPDRPQDGTWWLTPGGGAEDGESFVDCARRELLEETGHVAGDMGDPVHHRTAEFEFMGVPYRQVEQFFLVRATATDVDTSRWTQIEIDTMSEWRWWTMAELDATTDVVYPEGLATILRGLLDGA